MSCELCDADGGAVLWRDDFCRVVRPAVEGYPGFLRVIVTRHVKEMTDLGERERLFARHQWDTVVDALKQLWLGLSALPVEGRP